MKKYSRAFACQRCGKVFSYPHKLSRHERNCEAKVKHIYQGGVYTPRRSIFEKLEDEGIQVPEDLKFSKYFATNGIEVFYPKSSELPAKKPKLQFIAEYKLLSVCVASNVPNYKDPECMIVNGEGEEDAQQLVENLVTYLNEIVMRLTKWSKSATWS